MKQYLACWYLFECNSIGDSKYGHEIPKLFHKSNVPISRFNETILGMLVLIWMHFYWGFQIWSWNSKMLICFKFNVSNSRFNEPLLGMFVLIQMYLNGDSKYGHEIPKCWFKKIIVTFSTCRLLTPAAWCVKLYWIHKLILTYIQMHKMRYLESSWARWLYKNLLLIIKITDIN